MEKTPVNIESGLVPYHENGNGVNGAQNQEHTEKEYEDLPENLTIEDPPNKKPASRGGKWFPVHYFDVSNGTVLEGKQFLEIYLRSGADPENIKKLSDLLRDSSRDIRIGDYPVADTIDWTNERYKRYGRLLSRIVDNPSRPTERKLNQKIINRARALGLGPASWTIREAFGSLSNFYEESELTNTYRRGNFDDLTVEDLVKHVRKVGQKLGRRPRKADFINASQRNVNCPSFDYMYGRFEGNGGVGTLIELAGWPVINNWETQDYIDWGIKLLDANGNAPKALEIYYLSKKDKGPSIKPIEKYFGSLLNFQDSVKKEHDARKIASEEAKAEKIDTLITRLQSGTIPEELFEGADSEQDILIRFAKYSVLEYLSSHWNEETKVNICTDTYKDQNYIRSIRRSNNALSAGDIEHAALILGHFDDIWPMDNHKEDLKLGKEYEEYHKANMNIRIATRKKRKNQQAIAA
jgi:hypothetical protein